MKPALAAKGIVSFAILDQVLWYAVGLMYCVSTPWLVGSILWRLGLLILVLGWCINRRQLGWLWLAVRGVSWYALIYGVVVAGSAHYALPSPESLLLPENPLDFWTSIPPHSVYAYAVACVAYLVGTSVILPRL